MDPVSVLVFNALAKRQGINLPGIGALHVVTVGATMEQKDLLVPPANRVELLPDPQPDFWNIVDLIARYSGTDYDSAQEFYNQWLAEVSSEDGITIDSVGTVRNGMFRAARELAQTLNPAGNDLIPLPQRASHRMLGLWITLAVLVGVGISVGVISWLEREQTAYPNEIAAIELVPATPVPAADTAVRDTAPTGKSAADTVATAQSAPARETIPAAKLTPAIRTSPASAKKYYVIVGAYSTEENADRFIASARKKDDTLSFEKLPQANGRILISIFGSDSEQQATQKKRDYESMFEGLWVYKASVRK